MEVGRVGELTMLTPSEVYWVGDAMRRPAGGETLGQATLRKAAGRTLTCVAADGAGATCGAAATHYTRSDDGLKAYCAHHWANDMDPENATGMTEPGESRPKTGHVEARHLGRMRALVREHNAPDRDEKNPNRGQEILEELLGVAVEIDEASNA